MLGLPEDTAWLDVESPFSAEQLAVRMVRAGLDALSRTASARSRRSRG